MEQTVPDPRSPPLAVVALGLSVLFGVAGQLLMKWAALRTVGASADWSLVGSIGVALFIYSLGILNWMFALRHLRLSLAYPLTSLNYVGILAGSHYWFGEQISPLRAIGVALIFLGVMLTSLRRGSGGDASAARQPIRG